MEVQISLSPLDAADEDRIKECIAGEIGVSTKEITGFNILRRSVDARSRQPRITLKLQVFINEPFLRPQPVSFHFKDVSKSKRRVVLAGAGPASIFAALQLIESGIKPIILERGKDVRNRRRDLAVLNREGILNTESNYCFGEGGAGTYSDGKLYTRSHKRGSIDRILQLFVHFGADEKILYEAHPHIGTNRLPAIITAMRNRIVDCGGEYHFNTKLTDLAIRNDKFHAAITENGEEWPAHALILATGHSASDIFEMLQRKNIAIHFKPFALGVRVEHPQQLIDNIQYHCSLTTTARPRGLPPAPYSLVQQVGDGGVFSFCMCPGGIIAPAATHQGALVVNGWSPSKRNNPFANSGIVTPVGEEELRSFQKGQALRGLAFQRSVEEKAYKAGGGKFVAPAQRLEDFTRNRLSTSLPDCSYVPGVQSALLSEVLPSFVYARLKKAFPEFGKKMKGYFTNDAIVVATESRTSSPVRIPRNNKTLEHDQVAGLYPCGEGAGYAGGIVSAAMDGERVARAIAERVLGGEY